MTSNPVILALEEQVGCYRRLARLAEAQHEHVQQSHIEGLLEVLQDRQAILDQLVRLEQVIGPAKRQWPAFLDQMDSSIRLQAESMLAETRQLLESIMASDRNDSLALQQRKISLGRQINQASSARQINRNYAASAYGQRTPRMNIQQ